MAALGARAGREGERHGSEDHREGGHEDRPEAQDRGLDDGVHLGLAGFLELVGELGDQNAVFGDQADQGYQPDLAVDVERIAGELKREQGPDHR